MDNNNNVVTKQVTSGTRVEAIGTVKTIVGEVKAIDPNGNERILQAGDKVYPNETIMTAVGALVLIEFVNGTHLDLPSASQIVLDTDVFDPTLAKAGAGELTAEQIQEMIARGEDPTAITEATAAGAGAGDEGGSSFVVVDFNNAAGQVTSGFETQGIPGPESTTFTELPPVEEEPAAIVLPVVSVSVNVDTEVVGGGEPGPDGVILIPGGTPVSGGVSGVNVAEGSDGFMHMVSFVITLNSVATQPVTITYTIVPESATYGPAPDGDFFDGGLTKTVTIPAGFIGFVVTENIVADIKVEGDETFKIVLSNPINATLTNDTATVTIIDDDMNPVAHDDTNWVQEDNFGEGESVITSGNVLQTIAHPGDPSPALSFADAADVDDNPLILTWGGEAAVYGSIVKNADGSYSYMLNNANPAVQGLSAGETLTETFTYTITDGVNTPDTGTLTITIFGSDDGVTIRGIGSTQGDETVSESNLPAGSSPAADALTQVGSFTIVAPDGIASVNVGDAVLTLAQLQSAATFPVVIDTTYGALTLTGYSGDAQGGTVSYSYTLDTTVDNDSQAGATGGNFIESVAVTVTDEDGSSANSSVTINIVDDVPTAANDGPAGVVEDGLSVVSGNVLGNDTSGADTSKVFDGWSAVGHDNTASVTELSKYGTLVQNADGSWSYTLNNADPDTQALTAASNLSYDLWYTMKDADGDTSPAKLTITITGASDNASVVTAAATGPDNTVFEAGLNPNGSNAGSNSETSTGSFTVSATDGILNIVVGGSVFTFAQMQAFNGTQTVNTDEGVLTLTGYSGDANSGTVSYSYTLSATIDNDSKAGATGTEFDDSVLLTVNGAGGSTDSDNLVVRIVDDLPTAANDGPAGVTEDGTSVVLGNVLDNDASGADTAKVFDSWTATGHDNTASVAELSKYGTLVQNANGSWSYTLNNADADTQALTAASNLSYDLWYTMKDADGDTSPAKLTITITGANDSASVVTASASGPDNTVFEAGLNPNGSNAGSTSETSTGSFTVSATDGILNVVIGGTTYTLAQMQAFNGTQTVNTGEGVLTLTGYSGTATNGTVSYSYTVSATIDNDSKAGATATEFDDSLVLTVNGVGGSTASDNLVVRIVDDVPSAADDGPSAVTEDGTSFVSGNVLDNDASGADTAKVFDSWTAAGHDNSAALTELSKYGSLVQNANGSWSYTLNNADADTQALTAADHLSYDLWYTMKDADGDTSPAKLTIIINGANDSASVVTASASGPDDTVQEAGLNPNGSNAASNSETSTGSFTVSATDGILNIVVGGTTYTLAQMQAFNGAQSVNTGEGILTLTGYSGTATSGTVSYSYTLSATIDNDSKAGATLTHFDDSVLLTVNGAGGSTASDDLVVRIVDDLPQVTTTGSLSGLIVDETNLAFNDTDSFAGAFSFTYGADGAAAVGAKTYSLGVNTSSPTGLIDTATGQAVVLSLNGSGVVEGHTAISGALVFTLSVDSVTGGAVLDQLRAIQHESGTSVDTLNSANLITLTATITDGDNDLASATVNIGQSISFYDDGPAVTDTNGVIQNLAGQSLAGLIDYDLGADGTGSVSLSYTGPALTSHGKSVVFSLEDTNNDGIKELVGKADLDGNGSLETTVLTLAVAAGDTAPEDGAYTLTMNDVIDLPVTRTTLLFDDISAGGGKDQVLVGAQLLIEDTNIADSNAQVKASSGFVGIDNNIMNTGETVVYKFGDTISGSASPNYTITQKAIVNDVALKLFDTGSGSDTFTWTAYKNGVQVGTGSMTVGDHQNYDFTNNLSGITESGSDTTSDGLIHVDGGYDQLNISVTSGSLKVGGVSYISVSNPEDLDLSFGYTATDADGDAVSGSITTTVSATTATALSTAPTDIDTLLHTDNNIQP